MEQEEKDSMSTSLTSLTDGHRDESLLKEPEWPRLWFKIKGPDWKTIMREAWAEFVSVAILVAIACGTACYGAQYGSGIGYIAAGLVVPATISALVGSFGVISGAHLNPVMSLAFWMSPVVDFTLVELIFYVVAQLLGSIFGALCTRLALPAYLLVDGEGNFYLGENLVPSGTALGTAVFAEAFSTFVLVTIALLTVPQNNAYRDRYAHASGATAIRNGYRPRVLSPMAASTNFAFYAVMAAIVLYCGPVTGGSFNPARSFGPAVVGGHWKDHWVYWLGPNLGAILAVAVSLTLRPVLSYPVDLVTRPAPDEE